MGVVRPHLWFDDQAVQAARFYADVIPRTTIHSVVTAPPGTPDVAEGAEFIVELTLDGLRATFLNGGPHFALDEAFSFVLDCQDQAEVDHFWEVLTADGGRPSQCGWLVDKFGVSWQVTPVQLEDIMSRPDAEGVARAMAAMLTMGKLDVDLLERAYRGE
ncbi:VOC family protein [Cellulomonas humilata]|uniref:VOC family protein n=1 Tax=Cellulomonas humilata TaxID=144055 RepID=A0A7Y6A215_9CELL|nr:VOC family protein [Cellulomonas humilata]NUU18237.1 VOC family protein [Cellulomonas humilata]